MDINMVNGSDAEESLAAAEEDDGNDEPMSGEAVKPSAAYAHSMALRDYALQCGNPEMLEVALTLQKMISESATSSSMRQTTIDRFFVRE